MIHNLYFKQKKRPTLKLNYQESTVIMYLHAAEEKYGKRERTAKRLRCYKLAKQAIASPCTIACAE